MAATADDHVKDQNYFHIFDSLFGGFSIDLPKIFGLQITKYMILELIAAGLIIAIFVPLAKRAKSGEPPNGRWWNAFESAHLRAR